MVTQRKARPHKTMPRARVMIRKETPVAWATRSPNTKLIRMGRAIPLSKQGRKPM